MKIPQAFKTKGLSSLLVLGVIWFASSACNSGPTRPPDTPVESPCPLANPEDPCWDKAEYGTPVEAIESPSALSSNP